MHRELIGFLDQLSFAKNSLNYYYTKTIINIILFILYYYHLIIYLISNL